MTKGSCGFHGVRYQVKDVSRSVAFYTRYLGFSLEYQQLPAFADVAIDNLHLLLSGPGASGSRPLPDGRQQVTVTQRTSDPILDDSGNPILVPEGFQLTVPLLSTLRIRVTSLVIEANVEEGGPAFLEVRDSLDDFKTVVARIATTPGSLTTYTIPLALPSSAGPVESSLSATSSAVRRSIAR